MALAGRKRVLHLLTFAVTTLPLMVRTLFWRPDVVWLAAPAFVCAPAALVVGIALSVRRSDD